MYLSMMTGMTKPDRYLLHRKKKAVLLKNAGQKVSQILSGLC